MNKIQHILIHIALIFFVISVKAQDHFAEIGTRKYEGNSNLVVPQPPLLSQINLPVKNNKTAIFKASKVISTNAELRKELEKLIEHYEPFLKNHAPELTSMRKRIPLNYFKWREETSEDQKNFNNVLEGKGTWTKVNIPHYGPPLGRATTYYLREINITEECISEGNIFICFEGVDYKATIFFNSYICGTHEGFFAPFEYNVSNYVKPGKNLIIVKVENDFTTTGDKDDKGNKVIGNKIYGASGPGYDDPEKGWHHCPPGMGIYQECYLEVRSPIHINDIFVRPQINKSSIEAWIEINNYKEYPEEVKLNISIFGKNFKDTILLDMEYIPFTTYIPGVGDLEKPTDWQKKKLKMGYGINYLVVPIKLDSFRLWNTEQPWLYEIQVEIYDNKNRLSDTQSQHFGMRDFYMDTVQLPKGKMYLNGEMIRLRGANTMGHLQQCVIRQDWEQLKEDILLAKLTNMNFMRFTQRPVQEEIYNYCDMLGMLNQTDLPLFGGLRRSKFTEAVKQAEEMERLVRKHPSTVLVTYINERFPNAEGFPHRSLNNSHEYQKLFKALDQAVLLSNPDRVIKAGDGDYDPPSPGLPDNHCYNIWYNGHGLDLGKMYKGYWQPVKPEWYYGCGEFGAEGLDPLDIMNKYYPASWLPEDKKDEKIWTANRIPRAQTHRFHYMWYNTQYSLKDWINASQQYQAEAVKFTTETFRRDNRMVSFAVHLFIDAWPAGWMKTIMDVERKPKKAYFAYRNALEPLLVTLRSDRKTFYSEEKTAIEVWISNDLNKKPEGYQIKYQLEQGRKILFANQVEASVPVNSSRFQGFIKYILPKVKERTTYLFRVGLFDANGNSISQNQMEIEVFPKIKTIDNPVFVYGKEDGIASEILHQAQLKKASSPNDAEIILIDDYAQYQNKKNSIDAMVKNGKTVVFLELPSDSYKIANSDILIKKTSMGEYFFVNPQTGHHLVEEFKPLDFRYWYNEKSECIAPLLSNIIIAPDWIPVITSGATNWIEDKGTVNAVAELPYGNGVFRICEVKLNNRINTNPVVYRFLKNLLTK